MIKAEDVTNTIADQKNDWKTIGCLGVMAVPFLIGCFMIFIYMCKFTYYIGSIYQ